MVTEIGEVDEQGEVEEPGTLYTLRGRRFDASFVRGDANADAEVNLADAVFALNHLFLGGPPPACLDAADFDDDGSLVVTDAVFLLNFLFLGAEALPPPYPERGEDPTLDGLGCRV